MEKSESYIVPAFDRGLKLIELLGKTPDGSTIPEMECLNIPPASLFRLLATQSGLRKRKAPERRRTELNGVNGVNGDIVCGEVFRPPLSAA